MKLPRGPVDQITAETRGRTTAYAAAPLAVIPAVITAVKFEGGHTACHSFELAAECAAAS